MRMNQTPAHTGTVPETSWWPRGMPLASLDVLGLLWDFGSGTRPQGSEPIPGHSLRALRDLSGYRGARGTSGPCEVSGLPGVIPRSRGADRALRRPQDECCPQVPASTPGMPQDPARPWGGPHEPHAHPGLPRSSLLSRGSQRLPPSPSRSPAAPGRPPAAPVVAGAERGGEAAAEAGGGGGDGAAEPRAAAGGDAGIRRAAMAQGAGPGLRLLPVLLQLPGLLQLLGLPAAHGNSTGSGESGWLGD